MSADNCIAILKTTDKFKVQGNVYHNTFGEGIAAYRVAHIQAADSFNWLEENELHNLGAWMQEVFKFSFLVYNYEDALDFAHKLLDNIEYVEYGIVEIDASKYNFPGC